MNLNEGILDPIPNKAQKSSKTYSFDDALKAATEYFEGDALAANVWVNKYALKDSFGKIYEKSPDEMHWRLANEIARADAKFPDNISAQDIYKAIKNFKYIIPQGSPMAGIGNDYQFTSLSNCFVIGNGADSYGGIMKVDEEQAQLMKRRGGVGHDLSHIRPSGSKVMNSALNSTGIVPFMERYSNSTREVAQDGRRGALMLSVSVQHPDSESFIDAKLEQNKVTGANISVRLTDEFMKAALGDLPYQQQFPIDTEKPDFTKEVSAKGLWDKITFNAWKSAEPGVLFWDTIINESIPDCYGDLGYKTVSTNPCGEIPLCPYDSCRLLAINLYSFVEFPFMEEAYFNFEKFKKYARLAQRMMDDIIELEIEKIDKILEKIDSDPEKKAYKQTEFNLWSKIRNKCVEGRRTGIGITAEGDMLAALNLKYASDEAIDFSEEVHKVLALTVYRSSVDLAKVRGSFEIYDSSREVNNPFINRIKAADIELYNDMVKYGRRNIALLTIAPTGSVSLMTQTSSGIEPAFQIGYKRRRKVNPNDKEAVVSFVDDIGDSWEEYNVFHHKFLDWLKANGHNIKKVVNWPAEKLDELIAKTPYHLATANDVDWVQKVTMQGRIQKWVDHSISVTVNVPNETPVEMVREIYKTAWEVGCKGCTIYRDGSRSGVLISAREIKENEKGFLESSAPRRPKTLDATVVRFKNNKENWLAVVGLYEDKPYEIFTGKAVDAFGLPSYVDGGLIIKEKEDSGKNRYDFQFKDQEGYCVIIQGLSRSFNKEYWNYAKLISSVLRHGMPIQYVVDLVDGLNVEQDNINTWKNGVVRALKKFIPDGTTIKETCQECGEQGGLVYREGCLTCHNCGHSKCG